MTGEHLCFGELRCRLPISVENIGGIIDLIAFKDVQVQRRKAVDHIAPEVLRAKDAEVGSHVPQMFVTLADNSLLSFGFALYDLVDIRFPVILKAGSRDGGSPKGPPFALQAAPRERVRQSRLHNVPASPAQYS